jgi:hypothetical protein
VTIFSPNYTLQILHTKSSLHSRPYRTELSTGHCTACFMTASCPWFTASQLLVFTTDSSSNQSQNYVTTDGRSARLSWNEAPIWGLRPGFYYCQTFAGLLMSGAVSDEKMGLPFATAAGLRQCSHSRARVPWYSWPYFTVSDSRLPQPGGSNPRIYILSADHIENIFHSCIATQFPRNVL